MSFAAAGHAVFLFSSEIPLPNPSASALSLLATNSSILYFPASSSSVVLDVGSSSVAVDLTGIDVIGIAAEWDRDAEEMSIYYGAVGGGGWVRAGLRPCLDTLAKDQTLQVLRCGTATADGYVLSLVSLKEGPLPDLDTNYPILGELSVLGWNASTLVGINASTVIGLF